MEPIKVRPDKSKIEVEAKDVQRINDALTDYVIKAAYKVTESKTAASVGELIEAKELLISFVGLGVSMGIIESPQPETEGVGAV